MYFPYFHSFTPQKSFKVDNNWLVIEFFGNKISKCTNLMKKNTPVLAYLLLLGLSNKLILFGSHYWSPCMLENGGTEENYDKGEYNSFKNWQNDFSMLNLHLLFFFFKFIRFNECLVYKLLMYFQTFLYFLKCFNKMCKIPLIK